MARLQILELPQGSGDDRPPFLLVIDQVDDGAAAEISRWPDNIASRTGARHVLCFSETVDIPANEPPPLVEIDDVERAGTTQIVYAHERTRLDLCNALLLSGDATWRQLVEQAADRQKAVAALFRAQDDHKEGLLDVLGMDRTRDWDDIRNAAAGLKRKAEWAEKRKEELGAESLRRGKVKLEYAERVGQLETQLNEARQWARHGYEIGQRHCSWTDHGVAPAWLTEGWGPAHFGTCEHLQRASDYDEALTRVRNLSTEPEVMDADQPNPDVWRHGYRCGVLAARSATRPRDEKTSKPEGAA